MLERGLRIARTRAAPLVIVFGSLASFVLGQTLHTQLSRPETVAQASHSIAGINGALGPVLVRSAPAARLAGAAQHPKRESQGHGKEKDGGSEHNNHGGGKGSGHGDRGGGD
ncbi:MAG TPA: hypothetical protein VFU88_20100 [Ktedonobacterales bacterium]|nr:hypothetical protein [Ktedonobacterales bacterium]